MNPMPRFLAVALLAATAGCSSLIGGPAQSPTLFAPQPEVQADPAWPAVTWSLVVAQESASGMLAGSRIVVSPAAGEVQVYKAALWARPPAAMVEDAVLRTLEDSGKIAAVARQDSGIAADYRLLLEVRSFQSDYAGSSTPSAVVEVNAKLLRLSDQALVGNRNFRQVQAAQGTEVARVADAFALALGAVGHDIAGWTLQAGPPPKR